MTTSEISDQVGPDSIKVGGWLFRHRTAVPMPFVLALLLIPAGPTQSWTLIGAGVVLTLAGEALRMWAVHHIGVISRTRSGRLGPLITSGPFAIVRNPLYLGNFAIWMGFGLVAQLPIVTVVIGALLFAEYHAIVRWEEQRLESQFGDRYRAYASRVPRWVPGAGAWHSNLAPEPGTGAWHDVLFSERGTLIAIAGGYALLWLKARS